MLEPSSGEDRIASVVLDGRKRLLLQSAMRDALLALAIGGAGVVVLLAVGTTYFPPALLWLFAAAGIAVGVARWKRSQPRPYRVAQLLDHRWQTDDQVSTAYYFLTEPVRTSAIAKQQRDAARELAAGGDLVAALPFRVPRAAWAVLAMLALSATLFVVRYALQPALSLNQPLSSMLIEALLGPDDGAAENASVAPEPPLPRPGEEEVAPSLSEEAETRDAEKRETPPEPPEAATEASKQDADPLAVEMPEVEGLTLDEPYGDEMDYNSLVESEQAQQQGQKGQNPSEEGTPSDQESADGEESNDPWNQQNDSLLDRLKDAFQNMLAKMNMEPQMGPQKKQADSESQSNGESTGEQAEASEGQAQGGASESGEAQMEGGEPGQASSQQIAQGENGNTSDQPGEGQPSSSAGGNDGSKEAAENAAIEEALGRLEELYSRRAEEMRGEVMIETETARQTARTPFEPQAAGHEDLGGTVSRDAIPLAYQSYIKSYFENLRTKN